MTSVSGATAVSPYLLSQLPAETPKLLLRGVVSNEIMKASEGPDGSRRNWVVFSGTHEGTQGLEQLVDAWQTLKPADWELHIAGQGPITSRLEKMAGGNRTIVFHGLLNRLDNARLLCAAKIGMNPQDVTRIPGNVFAFKIVEYLAAGIHVVTTPRGTLEPELEAGMTYIPDNTPETIATCLGQLMASGRYDRKAEQAARHTYGPEAVSRSLNNLLVQVTARAETARRGSPTGIIASASE